MSSHLTMHVEHASACNLRMWTINGKLVGRTHVEVQVHCLCYTAAPEGVYINVLVGGLANGNVRSAPNSWDTDCRVSQLLLWTRNDDRFSFLSTSLGKNLPCKVVEKENLSSFQAGILYVFGSGAMSLTASQVEGLIWLLSGHWS